MPVPAAVTAFALAQGIPALLQGGIGTAQLLESKDMLRDLERPEMEIPDSAVAALAKAKSLGASLDMPGQDQAEMSLDQQVAGAASNIQETASSPTEALAALSNVYANRMAAQTNLAGQAAQSYFSRQQNIQNELDKMANWEQTQWEVNEFQPFQDKAATASALGAGGMQNLYEGIKGASGAVGGAIINKKLLDQLGTGADGASNALMTKMLIDQLTGSSNGMMGSLNTPQLSTGTPTGSGGEEGSPEFYKALIKEILG